MSITHFHFFDQKKCAYNYLVNNIILDPRTDIFVIYQLLLLASLSFSGDIELEVNDIAIEHFIVPTFLQVESLISHFDFRATSVQILPLHHFSADEPALKICMDYTSGLRCLSSLPERPALHFVLTCREVMGKLQSSVSNVDQFMNCRWLTKLRSSRVSRRSVRRAGVSEHFGLEFGGVGDHRPAAIRFNPLLYCGQVPVLLGDVLVASDIHQVDNRL